MKKKLVICFIMGILLLITGILFLVFGNANIAKILIVISVVLNTMGFLIKNREK